MPRDLNRYPSACDVLSRVLKEKLRDLSAITPQDVLRLKAVAAHASAEYQAARSVISFQRGLVENSLITELEWARNSLTSPGSNESKRVNAAIGIAQDAIRALDQAEASLLSSTAAVIPLMSGKPVEEAIGEAERSSCKVVDIGRFRDGKDS